MLRPLRRLAFAALLGFYPAAAVSSSAKNCGSVYFEAVRLSTAGTTAGLLAPKIGYCREDTGLEIYAAARAGADTRTYLDRSDTVYNDNFLFLGAGVDYVKLLPGVRLSAQAGRSFDLNPKIHRAGFDLRAGEMSYHELEWAGQRLVSEVYSEAFYVRRYRDLLAALQLRQFCRAFRWGNDSVGRFDLGPFAAAAASADSRGLEYNRYFEGHAGARLKYWGALGASLSAYYARGTRWDRPTTLPRYEDFRLLLAAHAAF